MPFVKIESNGDTKPDANTSTYVIINEKTPVDKADLIQRILSIISYYNIERLEISKDFIYYRYYPNMKVNESEMTDLLIDWYMKTLEK